MSTDTDLWGQDIALDADMQAQVAANGTLVLTDGVDTGVQQKDLQLGAGGRVPPLIGAQQLG